MGNCRSPRLLLSGTGSGCGKTTVTCALLWALKNRGLEIAGFKAGPDYIDPMFQEKVLGNSCNNLDLFLCKEAAVKRIFAQKSGGTNCSIIEGAMGLYDGLGMSDSCCANALALEIGAPTVLILSPRGMSLSAAAVVSGFLNFRKNNIAGVILNQTSEKTYAFYKAIIEEETGVKVYGFLPPMKDYTIQSRHLGLVTAAEISDIKERLALLGQQCERTVDVDGLLELAASAREFSFEESFISNAVEGVRIAVARDVAFCFYYSESLALLENLGAELVYFSPLEDSVLPVGASGLILGGGYPEEYAQRLSANEKMLSAVRQAVLEKMPIIAECGGFMYLAKTLVDRQGASYTMAGAIDAAVKMTGGLSHFGYVTLTAKHDNLLCNAGEKIPAHEFHYSVSDDDGDAFLSQKSDGRTWETIHATATMFAGYGHINFCGNEDLAVRFLQKCEDYASCSEQ